MAELNNDVPVVTLRSLLSGFEGAGLEGVGTEAAASPETRQRLDRAIDKLAQETEQTGADVFISVQDKETSMLQSRMAERDVAGPPLPAGGLEAKFGEGFTGGDWWGWIRSVFDHVDESRHHAIMRPADAKAASFPDTGGVAVLSDWGTNLYGAPVSAASMKRTGGFEMIMHLGDIYYSGTKRETKERFLAAWPTSAGKVSRALNGNHEMYSGGDAYFDEILPTFGQVSSYFAMQNSHWLLVGLDTAHTDHDLDDRQVAWLNAVVQAAGARKLVLFSHHQPFSRLDKQGPKLQVALSGLLQSKAITAWYWGHEHECILYEPHPQFGLRGRCVGHGGIPAPRKSAVRNAPDAQKRDGIVWKRFGATAESPACLVLDGSNPLVKGEESKFGPHGYLTLAFDGPQLIERIHLPDGTVIFEDRV